MKRLLAPLLAGLALPCAAQVAATVAAPVTVAPTVAAATALPEPETAAPDRGGEPDVKHTVIEGETTRIDELRVRGVAQRIVVTTKGRKPTSYEIITGDGSRDLSDGANTSRGAAGKRVWRVLNF
ncbi:MAG: hypothetical protein ABI156_08820 [Caldimonas sp.]